MYFNWLQQIVELLRYTFLGCINSNPTPTGRKLTVRVRESQVLLPGGSDCIISTMHIRIQL